MTHRGGSPSAAIRAKLDHPVIDGDGHWLEPIPIVLDFLRDVGGASAVDKFMKKARDTSWYTMTPAERMERRPHRPTWWGEPASTLDRATAMVPALFHQRLGDFGIDFALVYFGCEADDPMTAWAFDKHGHHRLRPIFSSDVGHFDVVDMTEVLAEAYELVEDGLIDEGELREFVFANPVRLHTAGNPDFFTGTAVEGAVAKELGRAQ